MTKDKVKIVAVQFKTILGDEENNLEKLESFFRKARRVNGGIICFPEYFLTGPLGYFYQDIDRLNYLTRPFASKAKRKFSRLCRKYGLHGLMGTVGVKRKGKIYNRSFLFDDEGKELGHADKINLVPIYEERVIAKNRKRNKVINTKLGKIGIQVCRDILYPEVTANLAKQGAQIVFSPAF
jgi:predicted amidohydrolase